MHVADVEVPFSCIFLLRSLVNGVFEREVEIYLHESGWTRLQLDYLEIAVEDVMNFDLH